MVDSAGKQVRLSRILTVALEVTAERTASEEMFDLMAEIKSYRGVEGLVIAELRDQAVEKLWGNSQAKRAPEIHGTVIFKITDEGLSEWHMVIAIGFPRFRHVALDFRGHGRSELQPSRFTNERLACDVLQLADELALDRFVVAGHSFGGKVALRVAAMAPKRVAGLVLIGAVGPGKVPVEREAMEVIFERASDVLFVREYFRPLFTVWPRGELDDSLENFARTPAWAHRAVCECALWTDITTETAAISTPALVVAGEHDPAYGPAYQCDVVMPVLSHARMVSIDCGHGLILERPEEIATHCEQFLTQFR